MAKHLQLGKAGEAFAAKALEGLGFTIISRNWRQGHWEIDIIAEKNAVLHFVEVKTRSSLLMGFPEESVTEKKMMHLIDASEIYCELFPKWEKIQFDIFSIVMNKDRTVYFFIEDVFI